MTIYPDTSFLFSRYLTDPHSSEVDRRLMQHPRLFVTPFHRAELANAIFQQVFRGRVPAAGAQLAYANFDQECADGIWVLNKLPERTFDTCISLANRHVATLGVRTLDTVHVAAALELGATRFWTFDQRQARLAEAEGMTTS